MSVWSRVSGVLSVPEERVREWLGFGVREGLSRPDSAELSVVGESVGVNLLGFADDVLDVFDDAWRHSAGRALVFARLLGEYSDEVRGDEVVPRFEVRSDLRIALGRDVLGFPARRLVFEVVPGVRESVEVTRVLSEYMSGALLSVPGLVLVGDRVLVGTSRR